MNCFIDSDFFQLRGSALRSTLPVYSVVSEAHGEEELSSVHAACGVRITEAPALGLLENRSVIYNLERRQKEPQRMLCALSLSF